MSVLQQILLGSVTAAGYSAEATAFFARLGTQPDTARKTLYNTFINALVSAGVWAKLDALYLFAANDSATGLTSLISSTFNATLVNAPTFTTDRGFTGASTKYINTNFNPTTASSPKFVQNSANIFVWSRTSGQLVGVAIGSIGNTDSYIYPRYTDDKAYYRITGSNSNVPSSTDGSGFHLVSRTGANLQRGYKNGSSTGQEFTNSVAPNNSNIIFLSAVGTEWWLGEAAAGGFGSQLSAAEQLALYNATLAYMVGVGAATPSWVPLADTVPASIYADFKTEGGTNHYYSGGAERANAAAWLTAISGSITRASNASRFNSSGVLEHVSSNVLRFDHTTAGSPLGILLEGERQNVSLRSEAFGTSPWALGGAETFTADAAVAPDGNTTADKMVATTGDDFRSQAGVVVISGTYTYSIWMKADSSNALSLYVIYPGATAYSCNLTTSWQRFSQQFTADGTSQTLQIGGGGTFSTGETAYMWGAQHELGNFPSSYIPTTSAAVVRAADALTRTRSNPTTIAMVFEARTPIGAEGTQTLWQIDDGSAANRIRIYRNASNEIVVNVTTSSSDVASINLGAVAHDTAFKVGFRAAVNDFAACLNGGTVGTDTSGTMPTGMVNERWGKDTSGNGWFGRIASHAEFATATNSALQSLTT